MEFLSYSLQSDVNLTKFTRNFLLRNHENREIFSKKVNSCGYKIILISQGDLIPNRIIVNSFENKLLKPLHNAWRLINIKDQENSVIEKNLAIINQFCSPVLINETFEDYINLQHPKNESLRDYYIFFLNGNERNGLSAYAILLLCNLWEIVNKRFPIHASGIIHKNGLYLFLGPSGAGKSTIASLSNSSGDIVLDEDQLIIRKGLHDFFFAESWKNSVQQSNVPVKAIFKLSKVVEDRLEIMGQTASARAIMEGFFQIIGYSFSGDLLKQSYTFSSEMARRVPLFKLDFRKTLEFWKLIDAEFELG